MSHSVYSMACVCYLVIYVAVGKHCVKILDTFLSIPVVTVLKPFLDCSHVHRGFDYCVVVLQRLQYTVNLGNLRVIFLCEQ